MLPFRHLPIPRRPHLPPQSASLAPPSLGRRVPFIRLTAPAHTGRGCPAAAVQNVEGAGRRGSSPSLRRTRSGSRCCGRRGGGACVGARGCVLPGETPVRSRGTEGGSLPDPQSLSNDGLEVWRHEPLGAHPQPPQYVCAPGSGKKEKSGRRQREGPGRVLPILETRRRHAPIRSRPLLGSDR